MSPPPRRELPPGRCGACAFPEPLCLCHRVPRIALPVRFVVLRHASEIPRLTSTARWAALALPGTRILDYALPGAPLAASALDLPGAWALFPSAGPTAAGDGLPSTIVVPDGTWAQARRMMQRVPSLRRMPRLSLPGTGPAPRLRRPTVAGGMSTLEAMAGALRLLGHAGAADRLDAFHAEAVAQASRLRGMPANVG